ncbi:unnamed protein product [Victoria cruziana]
MRPPNRPLLLTFHPSHDHIICEAITKELKRGNEGDGLRRSIREQVGRAFCVHFPPSPLSLIRGRDCVGDRRSTYPGVNWPI